MDLESTRYREDGRAPLIPLTFFALLFFDGSIPRASSLSAAKICFKVLVLLFAFFVYSGFLNDRGILRKLLLSTGVPEGTGVDMDDLWNSIVSTACSVTCDLLTFYDRHFFIRRLQLLTCPSARCVLAVHQKATFVASCSAEAVRVSICCMCNKLSYKCISN